MSTPPSEAQMPEPPSAAPVASTPTQAPTPTRAPSRARGSRPRGYETVRDIVLSMALVALVVIGFYWLVAWQRPEVQGSIRPEVDVAGAFDEVRIGDPFSVLEPTGLADEWQPTSVWFEPASVSDDIDGGVMHVGYVTPNGSYAEVKQTDGSREAAIDAWVDGAVDIGEVQAGDRTWTVVKSDTTGARGLVSEQDGVVVVVTGKAEQDELETLAASLR